MSLAPQAVTQFLVEAHHIPTEATLIINSLPNAELAVVERIVHQLDAIREILLHLDDPYSLPEELEELVSHVDNLLIPLETYLASPPPPLNANVFSNFAASDRTCSIHTTHLLPQQDDLQLVKDGRADFSTRYCL